MRNGLKLLLFPICFYPITTSANGSEWNFSVGLSLKQLSLDVYEKGETNPEGTLTEDYLIAPELGIESKVNYFSEGSWGYKYAFNFGRFEMNKQEVGSNDVNLGTSADGYFLYAMPVVVYDFHKEKVNSSILLGFGLGIGYLDASGDIIFTEANPQTRHDFDLSELTYSYGLLFEHEISSWSYGISIYGPEVTKGNYEYNLFDIGITVRKKFAF